MTLNLDPVALLGNLDPVTGIVVALVAVLAPKFVPAAARLVPIVVAWLKARATPAPAAPAAAAHPLLDMLKLLAAKRFPWKKPEEAQAQFLADLVAAELHPPAPAAAPAGAPF